MITIEQLIEELHADPTFKGALECVPVESRSSIIAQAENALRAMIGPMLPLINVIHNSPEAREVIRKQLVDMFSHEMNSSSIVRPDNNGKPAQ